MKRSRTTAPAKHVAATHTNPEHIGHEPLRILSIGAHPADVFDQSGGTMAHHADRGDWVGCCVLTDGARVHDKVISDGMFHKHRVPGGARLRGLMDKRASVKAGEVRRACARLGVKNIYFFDADDAVLLPNERDVKKLAALIRRLKPEIILTHYPNEGGGLWESHAAAGHIVMLAINLAQAVDPGDRCPPHRVAQVFFWGEGAANIPRHMFEAHRGFYNDVFIDITDVVEKKLACLDELVSQGYGGKYARKRIETSDGAFGLAGGVPYAEGFISYFAQTCRYLPLSDLRRGFARESDHEMMARFSYKIPTGG